MRANGELVPHGSGHDKERVFVICAHCNVGFEICGGLIFMIYVVLESCILYG